MESVVDGIRAYDGKSYGELIKQWRALLQQSDVEEPTSPSRCRLEALIASFLNVWTLKVSWHVVQCQNLSQPSMLSVHDLHH